MPKKVNIYEVKAHLSKIITKVHETGESMIVGSGQHRYRLVENWGQGPEGRAFGGFWCR